jgi:outer membrane receptor protein involved in Fe transport
VSAVSLAVFLTLLCQGPLPFPSSWGGTVIDPSTRFGIANALVTLVGERGGARTDAAGRFEWPGHSARAPVTVVVILPDGRVARPVRLDGWPRSGDLVVVAEPALAESVTISGVAPSIDTAAGASTTLLPRSDLELRNPATLAQALENVAGVSTVSDGGQGAVPAVRGLARGRSSIFVDGTRVSTERRAGPNASFLDPADIESIEIARGPGSVAYGSDSFGGIIAVRTRRGIFGQPLQGRVSGALGAGIPERRGEFGLSRGFDSNALLVTVRAREFDDYHSPSGLVPNSGWRDGGVIARWDHGGGTRTWSVGWQTGLDRQIGRPRSDSSTVLATTPFEDSHRLSGSYRMLPAGWLGNVRLDGMFGMARERTDQDRLATPKQPRNVTQADTSYRDAQMRVTSDRSIGIMSIQAGADFQGRYGLESDDSTVGYDLAGTIVSMGTNPSIASAHRTGLGIFGQASTQLTSRIQLSGGVRGDTVANTNIGGYFGNRGVTNGAVAGLAGATVRLTPRSTLTAQIARGFRDPTLTDRFYRGPVGRGFIEGNPALDPETSRQFDLTGRWNLSGLRLSAAFYDYRITNLVERYVVGGTNFFYRNRGAAQLRGAELEVQADLWHEAVIEFSAQASRGRDAETGAPIDDIAPRTAAVMLRDMLVPHVSSYLRAAAVARHAAAGPSEVPTPGYVSVDAGSMWHASSRVELRGALRNLLDQRWYSNAGPRWVDAPGRNGSVTFAVLF